MPEISPLSGLSSSFMLAIVPVFYLGLLTAPGEGRIIDAPAFPLLQARHSRPKRAADF
ncbi:MAG: hypothetical protein NVSMB57_15970 [Actinomycetota bacterium]